MYSHRAFTSAKCPLVDEPIFSSRMYLLASGQAVPPVSRLLFVPTGHAEQEREAESEHFPFSHAVQYAAFMPPARLWHSQQREGKLNLKRRRQRVLFPHDLLLMVRETESLRLNYAQLNLNRPLRISAGPRHLSRPLAT